MQQLKIITPIALVILFTIGVLAIPSYTQKLGITAGTNRFINFQINYQILLLVIAVISMMSSYLFNPEGFKSLFSIGSLSAPGERLMIFGIKQGDSWVKTGLSLSVFITLVTGVFMYFQLKTQQVDYGLLKSGILWILLFSFTNSFSEEIIYRLGINGPLQGLLKPDSIFLLSAVLFGAAHYQGMPNGLMGIILAGLLGYVLSKSVHETGGIFWAWLIHFLQDVVIIGSLFLLRSQ